MLFLYQLMNYIQKRSDEAVKRTAIGFANKKILTSPSRLLNYIKSLVNIVPCGEDLLNL